MSATTTPQPRTTRPAAGGPPPRGTGASRSGPGGPQGPNRKDTNRITKVSLFDQVSGILGASLALVGGTTAMLFLLWLLGMWQPRVVLPTVEIVEELSGRGDNPPGFAQDMAEPGMEEIADVVEPQIAEQLETLAQVISDTAAQLQSMETNSQVTGQGSGMGDARQAGPPGDGDTDAIPRWERWQIRFATDNINEYAKQLDFFKIELGLVGGGTPKVDYARNFGQARPTTRSEPSGANEKRLRFNYKGGPMKALDVQLLGKAGLNTNRREPLQFYPADVENQLATIELQKASPKTVSQIKQTIFSVVKEGNGYNFEVLTQTFR